MAQSAPPTPVHHALIAERARSHRRQPTVEEAALWQALRGGRLGVRFVRQRVVGQYIADLAAPSIRLIVEVDGGYHQPIWQRRPSVSSSRSMAATISGSARGTRGGIGGSPAGDGASCMLGRGR